MLLYVSYAKIRAMHGELGILVVKHKQLKPDCYLFIAGSLIFGIKELFPQVT